MIKEVLELLQRVDPRSVSVDEAVINMMATASQNYF